MQNTTERPSFIPWILLGVLSIIWGSSFILMKRGLDAYDPIQVAGLRLTISFLAMLPFALRNARKVKRKDWPYLVIVGWAGSGFPAFLFALAQTRISSAVAGMLNSLTPIFTLAIGMLFFGLIFRRSWLLGILLGLIGVFLIIGQINHWTLGNTGWFALAALGGTIFYAISGNTVKAHLQHLDSMTIGSLGFSTVGIPACLVLFSTDFIDRLQTNPVAAHSLGYIAILAIFGTVIASILFYYLIQKTDQIFGSMVSYLIPLVAVGWGILDGESMHWTYLAGLVLILAGVRTARSK